MGKKTKVTAVDERRIIEFGVRDTPCGCVAWMKTESRLQEKRFRNTPYSSADLNAGEWINEQVAAIHEMVLVEGCELPSIVIKGIHE